MKLSIISENRTNDEVVVLNPDAVNKIKNTTDLEILVEENAGKNIGYDDEAYVTAGARIVSREEAHKKANILVRRNAPTLAELQMMTPGNISMSMLHHDGVPQRKYDLEIANITGIALDFIKDEFGEREVYLYDITAENGVNYGYDLINKKPEECKVKIMGYGYLGKSAMNYVSKMKSDLEILNRKHTANIKNYLEDADILINAVDWPLERRGKEFIMYEEDLKLMKKGSVIIDLVVNPEGMSPIKTCKPTYVDSPHYQVQGIKHACVWGWPGMTPKKTSDEYSKLLPKYIVDIYRSGILNVGDNLKQAYVNLKALKIKG